MTLLGTCSTAEEDNSVRHTDKRRTDGYPHSRHPGKDPRMSNLIGYTRVSTTDHNPELQHDALTAAGAVRSRARIHRRSRELILFVYGSGWWIGDLLARATRSGGSPRSEPLGPQTGTSGPTHRRSPRIA